MARDFLARLTPTEIARLPRECRPGKLVDAHDISELAFSLTQRSCARDRISDDNLHRLASFFNEASQRLGTMHAFARTPDSGEPSRQ